MLFLHPTSRIVKINAKKCSFGLKEIPYRGYIITREGIKPEDSKKIQGIMDIECPKTTTDVKSLIGMVQYYRDMWKSHSHILAPLTEASGGPKGNAIDALIRYFCAYKSNR